VFRAKKNLKNQLGGLQAKRNGDNFEALIERACIRDRVKLVKIPSGCRWVRTRAGVRPIPQKTPFDFMACFDGRAIYFDAKSLSKNSFPYSAVEPHQVKELLEIEAQKFVSGYVIRFQESNQVAFFPATVLNAMRPRESIRHEDGIDLGDGLKFSLMKLFGIGVANGQKI
jgi:recombination protein U